MIRFLYLNFNQKYQVFLRKINLIISIAVEDYNKNCLKIFIYNYKKFGGGGLSGHRSPVKSNMPKKGGFKWSGGL
jgi:hypothetical protein